MTSNTLFAKFVDGSKVSAPAELDWEKTHTNTWDEEVLDEETGEVIRTEPRTDTWTEKRHILHPSAEEYADMGYHRLVEVAPSAPSEGRRWARVGDGESESDWEFNGDVFVRKWEEVELSGPAPRVFSKLKLYAAIASLKAWDTVRQWLEQKSINGLNGWVAFQLAQDISEDNALFVGLAEEARGLLGLTEEQFNALLDNCVLEE